MTCLSWVALHGMAHSIIELNKAVVLLMKVKEESEKVGLKLNIQKMKIRASGPITSWKIDGETVSDFILGGSKITADGDCTHEIKRHLLLGRKVMTNLDSSFFVCLFLLAFQALAFIILGEKKHIQKQRHYFANKGPSGQGHGFSSDHVWM